MTGPVVIRQDATMRTTYGMGRVYQERGCTTWSIAYSYRGTEIRERVGSRKRADAVRLLKARFAEIQSGKFAGPHAERVTVDELLADLVTTYEAQKKASLRTVTGHVAMLHKVLGRARARDVSTPRLWRVVKDWQAAGRADATINRYLETLRRAYRLAVAATPPKLLTIPAFPRLDEHNARTGYVAYPTYLALLAYLEAHDPVIGDVTTWAWWSGMRVGAICALEWSAVDRETATFTVPGRVQKNREPVKFPLNQYLRAVIERAHARRMDRARETGSLERLIFWRIYDGRPIPGLSPGDATRIVDFRKVWASAKRAAGCPTVLFHDFRRTALRNARRAGVDRRTGMLLSGHKTEATYERYLIDRDLEVGSAMARVTAYVEGLPATRRRDA
jgi:integrase